MLKFGIAVLALTTSLGAYKPECLGKTFATAAEARQSGCCSHHQGVCGCSGGRKTCCDGSVSPSCKC